MPEQTKKWEYQIYSLGSILKTPKDEELIELLDEWGEDGWELVSAVRGESTNRLTLIAKRPLADLSRRERSRPSY